MGTDGRSLRSVDRAIEILEFLKREEAATLTEITDELDITTSSVHVYLHTLLERNLIKRDGMEYSLGAKLLNFGESFRNRSPLYIHGRPEVDRLAQETGEAVHLIIENEGTAVILYEKFGNQAVGTEYHEKWREDSHEYLHCTGGGKAILAHLPEDQREAILGGYLEQVTENTITDPEALRRNLSEIRDRGYSLADAEEIPGVRAVGVPIFDASEDVLGALSLTSVARGLQGDRFYSTIPQRLIQSAETIEVNMVTSELL